MDFFSVLKMIGGLALLTCVTGQAARLHRMQAKYYLPRRSTRDFTS